MSGLNQNQPSSTLLTPPRDVVYLRNLVISNKGFPKKLFCCPVSFWAKGFSLMNKSLFIIPLLVFSLSMPVAGGQESSGDKKESLSPGAGVEGDEIGRASCRERG